MIKSKFYCAMIFLLRFRISDADQDLCDGSTDRRMCATYSPRSKSAGFKSGLNCAAPKNGDGVNKVLLQNSQSTPRLCRDQTNRTAMVTDRKCKIHKSGRHDLCRHAEGCDKHASFGKSFGSTRLFCALHRLPDYVDVKHRPCYHGSLNAKKPVPNGTKVFRTQMYCVDHRNLKTESLIFLRHKSACKYSFYSLSKETKNGRRCESAGCGASAIFGKNGAPPSACRQHREPEHVDLRHKRCQYVGSSGSRECTRQPSFGSVQDGIARFCRAHSLVDHVDVRSVRCAAPECRRSASFGPPDSLRPSFCAEHSSAGYVNVRLLRRRLTAFQMDSTANSEILRRWHLSHRDGRIQNVPGSSRRVHSSSALQAGSRGLYSDTDGWEILWKDADSTVRLLRDVIRRTESCGQAVAGQGDSLPHRGLEVDAAGRLVGSQIGPAEVDGATRIVDRAVAGGNAKSIVLRMAGGQESGTDNSFDAFRSREGREDGYDKTRTRGGDHGPALAVSGSTESPVGMRGVGANRELRLAGDFHLWSVEEESWDGEGPHVVEVADDGRGGHTVEGEPGAVDVVCNVKETARSSPHVKRLAAIDAQVLAPLNSLLESAAFLPIPIR